MQTTQARNPWTWVPSLYFGEAIPYVLVMTLSVVMYKDYGISNTDIALYTSWLYLPWVIKPLWSPFVDMFSTKRTWVVTLQLALGAALGALAFSAHLPGFFAISLIILSVLAFCSATHDIAADGFYILALPQRQQAAFIGVRSTFYRLATIFAGGALTYLAGELNQRNQSIALGWSAALGVLAVLFFVLSSWHAMVLPRPAGDTTVTGSGDHLRDYFATFRAFFTKPDIWLILGFIFTYRLGESQLLKLAIPFLKDPVALGGLGLSTKDVGIAYGTVGIIALTCGGLLGGWLISRFGLKRCLWPMVLAVHVPDVVFVYLATALPDNFVLICATLAMEQFGYGFGFTAMMMYMIMVVDGKYKTSHYAICTGFMALGMMVPGMISGRVQEALGYQHFFIYVLLMTIPAFIMAALVKIDPEYGKK